MHNKCVQSGTLPYMLFSTNLFDNDVYKVDKGEGRFLHVNNYLKKNKLNTCKL